MYGQSSRQSVPMRSLFEANCFHVPLETSARVRPQIICQISSAHFGRQSMTGVPCCSPKLCTHNCTVSPQPSLVLFRRAGLVRVAAGLARLLGSTREGKHTQRNVSLLRVGIILEGRLGVARPFYVAPLRKDLSKARQHQSLEQPWLTFRLVNPSPAHHVQINTAATT